MTVRLDGLDSSRIQDVVYTEFVKYLPDGKSVMEFSPGFILDGMLTPQYPEDTETGMDSICRDMETGNKRGSICMVV